VTADKIIFILFLRNLATAQKPAAVAVGLTVKKSAVKKPLRFFKKTHFLRCRGHAGNRTSSDVRNALPPMSGANQKPHAANAHVQVQAQVGNRLPPHVGKRLPKYIPSDVGNRV
jgi:hypothetical protein